MHVDGCSIRRPHPYRLCNDGRMNAECFCGRSSIPSWGRRSRTSYMEYSADRDTVDSDIGVADTDGRQQDMRGDDTFEVEPFDRTPDKNHAL